MHEYDKSSKWLIQHHGDSILRLAGITDIAEWRPLQAELVLPRRFPDGLIEVRRATPGEPELFILEIATYPEPRIAEQALRDAALVYLDRGILPEVVVLVLRPRGGRRIPRSIELRGSRGETVLHLRWHTVELANIPAAELLDAGDVGLVPWVTLARIDGPPEPVFRRCKERIDREAATGEKENLIAVAQVLASLRYNDEGLLQLLGGSAAVIESPLLQELKEQWTREAATQARREATHSAQVRMIVDFLSARFGDRATSLRNRLDSIDDESRLDALVKVAATCTSLKDFRDELGPPSRRRGSK
ncbi:hypothetical protein OJF2_48850 [Aquisphaera giovannonii]|uniref:DUF4351 domain-containing protein n=1 Tax=Aquisphaera giovannonii TaxID=406548 RepID=A0A5B9W7W1_9BACT|nr:hypothetical protein [Aquisphaera giovannonii]QEH36324.1 hypothetical protein OJF2_48850 [Aquisphaera giovannonii]